MNNSLGAIQQRMKADFRFGVYCVFGALALVLLLPIAIFRWTQGLVLVAVVELVIIAFFLGAVIAAWRGMDLERLGTVLALVMGIGGSVLATLSPIGLYWLYPIVMAIAFMVRPMVSVPVCVAVLGWLLFDGHALEATQQRLAVIASMGANAMFAMVFAQRSDQSRGQLEQLATRDALTGAENRRALENELEIAIAGFRRDARPVALAVLDLDHFKTINDRFGHDEGDRVLQRFVQVVQASVRRTDRLYRYGGEEFVLLMRATDELGLELAMSHLRSQIRAALTVRDEPVTVSIGGAILRAGEKRDAWFTRADDALYRAKQGGRNRLEIDDAE